MWRRWILTNINAAAHGRRTIGVTRPGCSVLTAGASSHAPRHRPSLAALASFDVEAPCSKHNHNRSGRSSLLILQHPSQSRLISSSRRRTSREPVMRECKTIEELSQLAHDHLDVLSPRGKSAFWTMLPKLIQIRDGGPPRTNLRHVQMKEQLDTILCNTLENIEAFDFRDITTTALGLAKIVKHVGPFRGKKPPTGSPHQILHDLLIGVNSENKQFIFGKIAMLSTPILSDFDARSLSNFLYAYGLAECVPNVDGGRTLFDVVAVEAIYNLRHFTSQGLSNMLWAYANVGASNSALFNAAGDSVIALEDLSEFMPQEISNIVWAYATAVETHPRLFMKFADYIVAMNDLRVFWPQHLSNIVWAYATAGESHPRLFKQLADHIVAQGDLNSFKPQALSNIVWAYATAGETSPQLFEKFANHVVAQGNLNAFEPQALSNIVWAYATAGESHPLLFQKLADVTITRRNDFNAQGISNLLWAYAVANADVPSQFNADFIGVCLKNENDFSLKCFYQLHQWQLWQEELKSDIRLPPSLRKKCREAFISRLASPSRLQEDVISILASIGLPPEDEFLTKSGYRIDALVEANEKKIGIEVDGPSHFVGKKPTGSTLLKHRQVNTLDEIQVISVPYWEWDKLGKDDVKKQQYLRVALGLC